MVEFAEPRTIRVANERDPELLQKYLPKGETDLHVKRYEQQKSGDATYLLVVQGDIPVGHLLINWNGPAEESVKTALTEPTPDVEDLFVHEDHRNRKVGSRLLQEAERLATERGYKQIGLSCGAENTAARDLYLFRGYADIGVAPYDLHGAYKDETGKEVEWEEKQCSYFVLSLKATATTEADTNMENNETTTGETTTDGTDPNAELSTPAGRPISDQVVDFAFGAVLTAAEALEKAVQVAQKEGPVIWEAFQEKGRPAREKLVRSLREETHDETEAATKEATKDATDFTVADDDTSDSDTESPSGTGTSGGGGGTTVAVEPPPMRPIKPAPRPFGFGRSSSLSAEDEIKALEDRAKALEREVAVSFPDSIPTASAPTVTEDAVFPDTPTTAESGTALVDFTPETTTSDALADSPYAISDDEERAAVPTQTGEQVSTDEVADESASDSPETTDTDTQLSPPKGKRSRKTTSEASSGTDSDSSTSDMTVEELES